LISGQELLMSDDTHTSDDVNDRKPRRETLLAASLRAASRTLMMRRPRSLFDLQNRSRSRNPKTARRARRGAGLGPERLGFSRPYALACQTIPRADMIVRRLVLDDDDIALVDQRRRGVAELAVGEERELAIVFPISRGFTGVPEMLPLHMMSCTVLNRYFHIMGQPSPNSVATGRQLHGRWSDGAVWLARGR